MALYPLKFQPIFKYRIWGGNKLKSELNKTYNSDSVGESWEISDVENDETEVISGSLKGQTLKQLTETYKADFLGTEVYRTFGSTFPLLIKYIDSAKPLSIQVHPGDEMSKKRHNTFGKSEMWYIMQADKNAEIVVGFSNDIDKDTYNTHLDNGTLVDVMHQEKVNKGDAYYIPTGRIHAIGAGVLLAEIQQTSDVTYRVYDYNRVDEKTGKERELHTDLAEDVIDFESQDSYKTKYNTIDNNSNILIHSPYFKTNFLPVSGKLNRDYTTLDSFLIYMCVSGEATFTYKRISYSLKYGETILIPASIKSLIIESKKAELLEIYL